MSVTVFAGCGDDSKETSVEATVTTNSTHATNSTDANF
jgi:hypothetical protein